MRQNEGCPIPDRVPIGGSFGGFPSVRIIEWNARDLGAVNALPAVPDSSQPRFGHRGRPEGCSLGSLLYDLDLESAPLVAAHDFR